MDKPKTQRDIAKLLGISPTAVSLVLKDPGTTKIAPDKKERILELAAALPHSRRNRRRDLITILMTGIEQTPTAPYMERMLQGVREGTTAIGKRLVLEYEAEEIMRAANRMELEGVILAAAMTDEQVLTLREHVPVVSLNVWQDTILCDTIIADERWGVVQATRELIDAGHKRIAFLGLAGEKTALPRNHLRERLGGYKEALHDRGMPINEDLIYPCPSSGSPDVEVALRRMLSSDEPPDAMVCYNDVAAARALQIAHQLGVTIPDQLAVVGFDNSSTCDVLSPRLSSIDAEYEEMGRLAVDSLLRQRRHPNRAPAWFTCATRLVHRDTT